MDSANKPAAVSSRMLWAGRFMSAAPVLMLLMSAVMKFVKPAQVVEGFEHLGYDMGLATGLGIVELSCTALYVFPRTSYLGAILLTGYLGGATATHVRVGDPTFFMPIVLGVLVWGGLFLRDPHFLARTVMVVDAQNVIRYLQITPEIAQLPDLDEAFKFARSLVTTS